MKSNFNNLTQTKISRFVKKPSHALIISSLDDNYNLLVAEKIAEDLIGQDIGTYAFYKSIQPTKNSISIDSIRDLNDFLKLKVPIDKTINRICCIYRAQTMTLESQNAILKDLEEPNQGTLLILCVNNINQILPTLVSRSQILNINLPTYSEFEASLDGRYRENEIKIAYNQAGGLPELAKSILNDSDHPLIEISSKAKSFISLSKFERLSMINESKDRRASIELIKVIIQIARLGIKASDNNKWQNIYESAFKSLKQIEANVPSKLVLSQLSLAF